ncbi:MAG: hypothetical protein BAJATHORv1_20550 [Candidatus Thorarchaeota archaeon]|nr:MAG: hypothetical protein BAJATHORv1_20550 [Candidatus Thorarchaeota archaeon]
MRSLHLSSQEVQSLLNHAEEELPKESVSLLFGYEKGEEYHVQRVFHMANTLNSTTRFQVDPEQLYSLLVEAEEHDEVLVAIFHSHPAPPQPSTSDLANMRLNPVVWVVASKVTGSWLYKGYFLQDDELSEVELVII